MPTEPILNNAASYGLNHTPFATPPNLSDASAPLPKTNSKGKSLLLLLLLVLVISLAALAILKFASPSPSPTPTLQSYQNPFAILEAQATTINPFAALR